MKFSFFFLIIFLSNNLLAENISHKKLVHLFSQNQLIEKSILDSKIDEEYLFRTIINLEKATKQVSRSWQNEIFKGPFIQLSPAYLNKKSIRVLYYKGKITAFYAEAATDAAFTEPCKLNEKIDDDNVTKDFNKCLENYKGVIFESFLMSADGLYVSQYKEPADFDL